MRNISAAQNKRKHDCRSKVIITGHKFAGNTVAGFLKNNTNTIAGL
jgi:hypothetical protein